MRRRAILAAAVGAALLLPAAPAGAVDFNVSNTTQLLTALGTANNNGVSDQIFLAPGTYNLTSALPLNGSGNLTLEGTGNAAQSVIRQTGASRVINIANGGDEVNLNDLTITGGNVSGGGTNGSGGGIRNAAGSGDLFLLRSAVEGNRAALAIGTAGGGGGIYSSGGTLTINQSSVSNNSASITSPGSGGGGIWTNANATINDSTISGNAVAGSPSGSGGGGLFTAIGGGSVSTSTFADNFAPAGNAIFNGSVTAVTLENSIFAGSGAQCAGGGSFTPSGNNIDTGNSCLASIPDTNPKIGPLANNGGGTNTRALASDSPAIQAGGLCSSTQDQRGVDRGANATDCDLGAYEFDGISVAQIPNCSPTGQIPLGMAAPPNSGVEAFHYIVDGVQQPDLTFGGGTSASATLDIPEGRRALEYWGQFSGLSAGELGHHTPTVLVDKTDPSIAIKSEQKRTIYVITRRASVDVNAVDGLSGLVGDPSANGERIGTRSRGRKTVTKIATDLCGNQQTAALPYRVLGPGLGTRAVLERLGGKVKVRRAGGGSAAAAQKGKGFVSLTQPREIPIGALLDTRKGRVRLTSSKSRRATAIQDGQFYGGLFQVLQSRKKRAKGLTNLRLKGSSFKRCATSGKGASAALSRRAIRRLRANAKGRFRTSGRFSAATVRGTTFTVTDRCDGTLTQVKRGRVAVRDFRLRKTVIVRAGKSYLARAPG